MGLLELTNIIRNSFTTEESLDKLGEYIKRKKINGLHYAHFIANKGVGCIVKPDYTTHNEATALLIEIVSSGDSPNTVRSTAYDLTKFLDFLMIFEITLEEVTDLEELLVGYLLYLRILGTKGINVTKSIMWSLIDYIPLVDDDIKNLDINEYGKRSFSSANQLSIDSIVKILQNPFKYIDSYNKRRPIAVDSIPRKKVDNTSTFSSTNKEAYTKVKYDTKALCAKAGIKYIVTNKKASPIKVRIPTLEEMELFMSALSLIKTSNINKLVIYLLKGFGIREGELSNILFDTSKLPSNFLHLNYNDALSLLKEQKFGDLYYNNSLNKWICEVRITEDGSHHTRRNKTNSREVFYIFEQEELTSILYSALRERELLIKVKNAENPDELFISPRNDCKPMMGSTVYSIVKTISKNISKKTGVNYSYITPHTFRHYYATYLLRVKKYTLDDVSRLLGHMDTETTRITYIHFLNDDKPESTITDMINTIK